MRIGELAEHVGVPADTIRFYERAGWLPRPVRRENGYREYRATDAEHLRLLIDLRRLEVPLDDAGRLAAWCHAGHCGEATGALPTLLRERRADVARRIDRLRELDARLADLERHLEAAAPAAVGAPMVTAAPGARAPGRTLTVLDAGGPCCDAAAAVTSVAEGGCACCVTGPTPGSAPPA